MVAMIVVINPWSNPARAYEEFEPTGTFSSLIVDDDPLGPGDLTGYEIVVKKTDTGYTGTFRVAEGGIPDFITIEPVIENGMISFTIVEKSYRLGKKSITKFIGFYDEKGISGTISTEKGRILYQVNNLWRLPHKGIWTGSGQ